MKVKCINAKGNWLYKTALREGEIYTVFQHGKDVYYIEELERDYLKTRFEVVSEGSTSKG